VIYLTPAQLLFIHARLLAETGGAAGIREVGLVAAAAARPQATFDSADLYPDLYHKAAALMDSLIRSHPFVDGNDRPLRSARTGITAAGLFLRLNGRQLIASNDELEAFTMAVARGEVALDALAAWLERYSVAGNG
jgi:death on curing protein